LIGKDGFVHKLHVLSLDSPTLTVTEGGIIYRLLWIGASGGAGIPQAGNHNLGGGGSGAGEYLHRLNVGITAGVHSITGGKGGKGAGPAGSPDSANGEDMSFLGTTVRGGGGGGSLGANRNGKAGGNGGGAAGNGDPGPSNKINADGRGNSGARPSCVIGHVGLTTSGGGGGSGMSAPPDNCQPPIAGGAGGAGCRTDICGVINSFCFGGEGSGNWFHPSSDVPYEDLYNDTALIISLPAINFNGNGVKGADWTDKPADDGHDGGVVLRYNTGLLVMLGVSEDKIAGSVDPVEQLVTVGSDHQFVITTNSMPIVPYYIKKVVVDDLFGNSSEIALDQTSQWGVTIPRYNIQNNWRLTASFGRATEWKTILQGNGSATVTPSNPAYLTKWHTHDTLCVRPDPGSYLMSLYVDGVRKILTTDEQLNGWCSDIDYQDDAYYHEVVASLAKGSWLNLVPAPYSTAIPAGVSMGGEFGRWAHIKLAAADCYHIIGVVTIQTPSGTSTVTVNAVNWESDFYIPPDSEMSANLITYTVVAAP
jgi:hypothetical protein